MFSYSGPALLVYPDGSAVELDRADLIETVTGGVRQWSGAGTAAGLLTTGAARIKLPTGGEADVVVSNVRVSGATSSATLLGAEGQKGRGPGD